MCATECRVHYAGGPMNTDYRLHKAVAKGKRLGCDAAWRARPELLNRIEIIKRTAKSLRGGAAR
jgi:hypothetical protein